MKITFTKKKESFIVSIERDDGTVDWTKTIMPLAYHDIIHYVLETELNYKRGFYGLINEGFAMVDFQKPKDQKPIGLQTKNLPEEALHTEFMVSVLQTHLLQFGNDADLFGTLKQTLEINEIELPKEVDEKKIATIVSKTRVLLKEFQAKDKLEVKMTF